MRVVPHLDPVYPSSWRQTGPAANLPVSKQSKNAL